MARRSITRRIAAAAVLAALSFGFAAPPAADFGLTTAGDANGKADSSDGDVSSQGISWK